MTAGVYLIRFDARRYVGSSHQMGRRWVRHRSDLRRGVHGNRFMQRLWDKGHRPAFQVLARCDVDQLLLAEQAWIDLLQPELNMAKDASANMRGRRHALETRARRGIPILCVEQGKRFSTAGEAAEWLHSQGLVTDPNMARSNINAARRAGGRAYGFTWLQAME